MMFMTQITPLMNIDQYELVNVKVYPLNLNKLSINIEHKSKI